MSRLPLHFEVARLQGGDIDLFAEEFALAAAALLPLFSGAVSCFALPSEPNGDLPADIPAAWSESIRLVGQRFLPITVAEASLMFLPIWGDNDVIGVMVFEALESALVERMSEEWLLDRSRLISRELLLRKQLAMDPGTGLLNGRHFHDSIACRLHPESTESASPAVVPPVVAVLLEIYPRAAAAAQALEQIAASAALLQVTLELPGVHHLGCGVFGLAWQALDEQQAWQAGKNLLGRLKQANVQRARMGFAVSREGDAFDPAVSAEDLLDRAWQALRVACRRGPFGLCSYYSIDRPDAHPLCRPPKSVRSKLARQWRVASSFAVVLLQQDDAASQGGNNEQMAALLGHEAQSYPVGNGEWYVYLDRFTSEAAVAWVKNVQARYRQDTASTLSAGVASYPCIDFTKSAVLNNARKALLHTRFYGPDTVTPFDGLSLNVSGDIYYDEGDLVRAAREYRKGLMLDPDNINLLNSLGEAYARMNRHRQAAAQFGRVLKLDGANYMALFNMGLAWQQLRDDKASIDCFEHALAVRQQQRQTSKNDDGGASDGSYLDLCMQLGRLYCRGGDHAKAVPLLEVASQPTSGRSPAGSGRRDNVGRGGALRYLGEAYAALGRVAEAMATLQRAVRFNPRDGASLSLLGELYARDNQGDDIALSFCQKAVELDPRPSEYWQRLGMIKLRLQDPTGALVALRAGLRRQSNNVAILVAMAEAYEMQGSRWRAATTYARVLRLQADEPRACAGLQRLSSAA